MSHDRASHLRLSVTSQVALATGSDRRSHRVVGGDGRCGSRAALSLDVSCRRLPARPALAVHPGGWSSCSLRVRLSTEGLVRAPRTDSFSYSPVVLSADRPGSTGG